MDSHPERVQEFWDHFADAARVDARFEAWAFAEGAATEVSDQLARLVLHGAKRATTGLYDEYLEDGEMPIVGGYSVVLDGSGEPVCIIRTTQVDVVPFGEVDEAFAWEEGEGDRSLADWRRIHERYFAGTGSPVNDETLVVLERFELVWPSG